jgi:hypothetical protein
MLVCCLKKTKKKKKKKKKITRSFFIVIDWENIKKIMNFPNQKQENLLENGKVSCFFLLQSVKT